MSVLDVVFATLSLVATIIAGTTYLTLTLTNLLRVNYVVAAQVGVVASFLAAIALLVLFRETYPNIHMWMLGASLLLLLPYAGLLLILRLRQR